MMLKPKVRVYNQYTHPIRYTLHQLFRTYHMAEATKQHRLKNACWNEILELKSKREPIHAV